MVSTNLLSALYYYVVLTSKNYGIDETHSLGHSMDVFYFANKIYEKELVDNSFLKNQENIIFTSAILHDMCDKKYMNEDHGISMIKDYLKGKIIDEEINASLKIMSTMSYSTVKRNGFPVLGKYQLAYNIVREADLLASYDFDRCIMYNMLKKNENYINSFNEAKELFKSRVLKYNDQKLFTTRYAKIKSIKLELKAVSRMDNLSKILYP